jgi:hypothetical protein
LGKGIQKIALRHGFRWNDGICKVRDCGENPFFMQINFTEGTMKYIAGFNYDGEYIEFKDSYEIESEFENPPEVMALKRAFQRYAKEWIEEIKPVRKTKKIKPKYKTWVKQKGVAIQHFHNMIKCVDDI